MNSLLFAAVALLCCLLDVSCQNYGGCTLPKGGSAKRQQAVSQLESRGYEVSFGYQDFNTTCKDWSPDCFGENPSSPYGTWNIKTPLLGNLSIMKPFQIGANDVLVFYGCTPPPARYWSLDLQVFISDRKWLFASLGDAQNQLTLNVTDRTKPFDTEILVVAGGDVQTRNDVYDAFAGIGVSAATFNTIPIPDTTKIGVDPIGEGLGHSVWTMVLRLALCDNKPNCKAYQTAEYPVLRVSPKVKRPLKPFPVYPLRRRGTGTNETYLTSALNELVAAVVAQYSHLKHTTPAPLPALLVNGRDCIKKRENCVGGTRDAIYMDGDEPLLPAGTVSGDKLVPAHGVGIHPDGPRWIIQDNPNDFVVICGVLHEATGKATYVNVAPYGVKREISTGAVVDTDLAGSAAMYIPKNKQNKLLYAYTFKRVCKPDEKFCRHIPYWGFPSVPLGDNITLVERAYLEKATKVGPAPDELLRPYVIHFTE